MFAVAIFVCLGWILSVCLHEFGHAVVAYWGGDTSVKDKGYLTLNPLKYTDLNLSLILPLFFLLIGGIALPGAAVYIDQRRLRNRWWQSAVSAAGPITSAIVTLLLALPFMLGLASPYSEYRWLWPALAFLIYLQIFVIIINSLPIPSLDGYGVIEPWLPSKLQLRLRKYSGSALIFLFFLLWYVKPIGMFLSSLSAAIARILGVPTEMIGVGFALFNKSSGVLLLVAIGAVLLICGVTRQSHERWDDQGNALSKSGRYKKAIAAYDKAIEIKPNYYEAWDNRGRLLSTLNRNEEALESYDKAVQIKPEFAQAWLHRARVLNELKRCEEALKSYDKVIQITHITHNNPAIWTDQGVALAQSKKYEEAINFFDKAIQVDPKYALAWHNKACCYAEQKNIDLAIKTLKQAIKIAPHLVKRLAKDDPSFDSIRKNQLFKQLID